MANSPHLALPYLEAAQAQKHVTHNEALRALDAVAMLAVLDRDLATPPGSPSEGDRYLVASSATAAWSGKDGKIAAWQDGAWSFHTPQEGWRVWIADEDILLVFNGASWIGAATQNAALIGVNTLANSTNRLAVSSAAVLFSHAGNGVQVKLNKSGDGDTASLLFQKSYSGRAEIGLIGNNDVAFKTSADGSAFATGLTLVAAANGVPRIAGFTVAGLPAASSAGAGAIAFVTDETGGAVLAFSDGANWRRVTDRAIVA
jgi:Protein of unknown function (DUF2793)